MELLMRFGHTVSLIDDALALIQLIVSPGHNSSGLFHIKFNLIMKDNIVRVLAAISDSIQQEHSDEFAKISETVTPPTFGDVEEFNYLVHNPIRTYLKELIKSSVSPNPDIQFIHLNYQFVKSQFESLIVRREGSQSCADKSRTIINRLIKYYLTGERIEFDYDQKYTFHLPKVIFKTHDDILEFYKGIHRMYYGNPDEYLTVLKKNLIPPTEE